MRPVKRAILGHQATKYYPMSVLSTQQQAHVNALLDELLDLPEDRRSQRLHSRSVDDPAVLSEAESLLRAALAANGFLRSPARPAVEAASQDVAVGMRLGAWRVTGTIGRGGTGEVYHATLAQALETLGDAQLSQGQTQPAIVALQEALTLRERSHDQTWELAVVRERLGEALAASGNAAAPSLLRQAAQSLEAILGAEYPQTIRAKDALAQFRT